MFKRSTSLSRLLTVLTCANCALSGQMADGQVNPSNGDPKTSAASTTDDVSAFVEQYCVKCHGAKNPKGKLALHRTGSESEATASVDIWKKVLDKLQSGEMPPADAAQPGPAQRQQVLLSIRARLRDAGEILDDSKWLSPSQGNRVDHDTLFSGKAPTAPTETRGRLWRLTGRGYEEFIQSLNVKYRLGFRTYGHHRVRAPWELSAQDGFRDYASQHRIGEPEIEHHLRNSTRVARAMLERLPKTRITELNPLQAFLKADDTLSPEEQVHAATGAAFEGILGRPPTEPELERYAGFLRVSMKTLERDKSLEQLLIAILFHPEVVYRIELPVDGATRALMSPRDIARSVAYALTDRKPDELLAKAAAEGKLAGREEIREQVVRVLNDPEIAKPRILRFFQEYFGYTAAIDVFKDSETRKAAGFRGKNDWHPNFFVSDTDRLIEWILKSDTNVLRELLTTSQTFAATGNTKEAQGVVKNPSKPFGGFAKTVITIYELEITRQQWTDERPFEMPKQHRMGILTHPSWLIAHSTNFDNHAIHRGRWIQERLLGGRIPDLPVTVDAQLPDEPEKTLRERMRVTRDEYCWKCHQQMDPLGLPFENFNHLGQYRTTELDKPVDATGAVADSRDPGLDGPVNDPFELIEKLASSQRVEQVFVRHVFRYTLGRNETLSDGPTLVAAHRAYVDGGGSMNALLTSLLTSEAFLYRTVEDPSSGFPSTRRQP